MDLTITELTLLGLLVERPQHGYELEQTIEQRGIRRWAEIGFSSIYYVLNKLERRGLVSGDEPDGGARARRVFRPTAAGREAAAAETTALLAHDRPVAHPFLTGLANLALLPAQTYRDALATRLSEIDTRLAAVEQARAAQAPLPPAAAEVFSFSLALLEAERTWLAQRVTVSR
ncbi:PadR family transcriptional regulator [Microbacterium sp.]|uniref:PadR family transcriptional regulator n=1 Tax=Microbacterium sp. TaxID=51671 RepID=UPI0039E57E2D